MNTNSQFNMNRDLEDLDKLKSKNTSDQIFSNDVGNFEGRPPNSSLPHHDRSSNNQEKQAEIENEFETNGSITFAMRLQNDPELNADGAVVAMEKSSMALRYSIPSKSGSNFFASCEGNTGFMKQRGFATSNLSLGYNIRNSTALLYDWKTADGLSKVSYGAMYRNNKSKSKVHLHYPPTIQKEIEPNLLSFSNTTKITDKISTQVDIQIAPSPTISSLSKFRIGLKTIHALTLPQVQIYLDIFHRTPVQLGYQQVINEEEKSGKEFFFGLGRNCFEAKALLTRELDNFTKFSIGVGHSSWHGLSMLFCLRKADLCLNVPIQINSLATTSYCTILYSLSSAYLGVLSGVIDMAVGELLMRTRSVVSSELKIEEKLLSVKKARSDAENQQMLMKRKSSINRRSEESKGGLVIEKATYSVEAGDCFDVTIPLQFWAVDSSLKLPSSSFGSMLGFYDIANDAAKDDDSSSGNDGLISLWKCLFEDTKKDKMAPVLHVKYKFNGKRLDLSTSDCEGLVLPNSRAREDANNTELANQK